MSEYIDFEVARKYLHEACAGLGSNGGLMLKIKFNQEPKADVVEVIRCEHCLHWDDEIKDGVYVGNLYHCCDYDGEHRKPWDFCSYGERREDGQIH